MFIRKEFEYYIEDNLPLVGGLPYDYAIIRPNPSIVSRYRPFSDDYSFGFEQLDPEIKSMCVIVLFTDVSADYYIREVLIPGVRMQARRLKGWPVFGYDDYMILRKELAVAAGLGSIGLNSLFFSKSFGFNCKIDMVWTTQEFDEYDEVFEEDPYLEYCNTCGACAASCPVEAYEEFELKAARKCGDNIGIDFNDKYRDNMCRLCIDACPYSNALCEEWYKRGVPAKRYNYSADFCDETIPPDIT